MKKIQLIFLAMLYLPMNVQAQLALGDVLLATRTGGFSSCTPHASLRKVDPVGLDDLVSDFENPVEGPIERGLQAVAVGPKPYVFALASPTSTNCSQNPANTTSSGKGILYRVDTSKTPGTAGMRELWSNLNDSKGGTEPLGNSPVGLAMAPNGDLLLLDRLGSNTSGRPALFRIDSNKVRTRLVDFGNPNPNNTTPPESQPLISSSANNIAVDANGIIYILDENSGTAAAGAIFKVVVTISGTGVIHSTRSIVHDFGNPGQGTQYFNATRPRSIAVDNSAANQGLLWVIDPVAGTSAATSSNKGLLYKIDPNNQSTANRVLVSHFGDASQGSTVNAPQSSGFTTGLDVDGNGNVLAVPAASPKAIFKLDPQNNYHRTLLHDYTLPPGNFILQDVAAVPWSASTGLPASVLENTVIKTSDVAVLMNNCATSGRLNLLTDPFEFTCQDSTGCSAEVTIHSDINFVSPGTDSVRFFLSVDGSFAGVLPNANVGMQATAKGNRITTTSMSWLTPPLSGGSVHHINLEACVSDTDNNNSASASLRNRTTILRVLSQ